MNNNLYKEKNGFYQTKKGLWGIAYTDEIGKRVHEVVASTLSEAKEIKRQRESEICKFKQDPTSFAMQKTVNEVADHYIEKHLKKLRSDSNISMFNRFCRKYGNKRLSDITAMDMTDYYNELAAQSSYANANRRFAVVSKFFNQLKQWQMFFGENPCYYVNKRPDEPYQPHPLSKEEVLRLLPHLAAYIRPAIKFCVLTGVRKKELLGLTWEDIDFNAKTILLRETKTNKSRMLGLIPAIEEVFKEEGIQKTGKVFKLLTDWKLRYQIPHAAKKAGLGHLRLHDLRHTFAVNFLNNDGKLHDLQILMGHSSIKTTQKYMKFKKEEVATKMIVMNNLLTPLPALG